MLARCYFGNNVIIYVLRWVPATGKRQTGCVEIWNDCKLGYLEHECETNFGILINSNWAKRCVGILTEGPM